MGFLGIVQNDIKRVIAYSTLSQLGYMTVALGASAYAAGIFHLMTHAFFKALLFLAAGSVIIAMHHDQDIRNMGGLRKYMPITWITFLIGTLALIGTPFFSGFYSKDTIIEAVHAFPPRRAPAIAYCACCSGVFITALYTFRLYFLVFHGEGAHGSSHPRTPARDALGGDGAADPAGHSLGDRRLLRSARWCSATTSTARSTSPPAHDVLGELAEHFHGLLGFTLHGLRRAGPLPGRWPGRSPPGTST